MTNCTIIIPTYNRPAYLHRILNYYDSFGEKFGIIIADSSSDENKEQNKEIISSLSNLDIKYLGHYSTVINPHHKMADMVNYAKTKYCVFCADDDFVTPEGIRQSVDFLEQNFDFAVAQGQYIRFHLENDETGKIFCWQPMYSHESITFSDSAMRLSRHLSDYSQLTIYGVHRTELLQMVYKETLKSEVDPMLFGELLPSMLILIYGKMKCLDVFYAARDGDSVGSWPTLRDAIEDGRYDEEYAKFRESLSTHLSKQSQLKSEESRKLVDNAMFAYMKECFADNTVSAPKTKKRIALDYLRLPDWMDRGIVILYNALFTKPPSLLPKYHDDFSLPPKYHDDFNKIRLQVICHLKTNYKGK